jgi:hypothetical protein
MAEYPDGRLQIAVVPGETDLRRGHGNTSQAELVYDEALPAGGFSFSIFYSHHRGEDVHGKPWVEDLDQLQLDLNILLSKEWEFINKIMEAPIVAPGGALSEDMTDVGGYNMLEIEPSLAGWRPRVMEWPMEVLNALRNAIAEKRRAIFTGGGYQAVSRGEMPGSRTAYRAIVALQQADATIHGPVNRRFRAAATDFMRGCWQQMKAYGDVPWLIEATGDEYSYLVEPYIDSTKLSQRPPNYKMVNAFGASPELRAQEVLELMQTTGADGVPFLPTEAARRAYPDQTLFDRPGDPAVVARRRAREIGAAIRQTAKELREQFGIEEWQMLAPVVQQAGFQVFMMIEANYPRLQDDDLHSHIAHLSEITQDETADPIARLAAIKRQQLYYEWQAQQAAALQELATREQMGGGPENRLNARSVVTQRQLGPGAVETESAPSQPATAGG